MKTKISLGKSTKRKINNLLDLFVSNSVNSATYFSVADPKDLSLTYLVFYPIWADVREPLVNKTQFNITLWKQINQ